MYFFMFWDSEKKLFLSLSCSMSVLGEWDDLISNSPTMAGSFLTLLFLIFLVGAVSSEPEISICMIFIDVFFSAGISSCNTLIVDACNSCLIQGS